MNNQPLKKLTIEDLLGIKDAKQNETLYKYGNVNNQKKYSRKQKCKP
jgi:hypothetical protein